MPPDESGQQARPERQPTLGSLFAGVGGLDLGFERAGFRTAWQVEIDPRKRAVLAARFPDARRFEDVRDVGAGSLEGVDCIAAGFPCQDISVAGNKRGGGHGLRGQRSGLFYETLRIVDEIRPPWLVLENVAALLSSNDHSDIEIVIRSLAERGYVGLFRVLDAQYFGVPQRRRRIFMVAGLGRRPASNFLFDAAPVDGISSSLGQVSIPRNPASLSAYTLTKSRNGAQILMGGETLVAEEDRWDSMVERQRITETTGLPFGMAEWDHFAQQCAGDSICPNVAEWLARHLLRSF